MPCCAFAACIVAQLFLGARAVKWAIFGRGAGDARNLAVEWRLDSTASPPLDLAIPSAGWLLGRRSLRGLALAGALELAIVLGAVYGIVEHLGHGAGHSGHAHRAEGLGRDRGAEGVTAVDPGAASSRRNLPAVHD